MKETSQEGQNTRLFTVGTFSVQTLQEKQTVRRETTFFLSDTVASQCSKITL